MAKATELAKSSTADERSVPVLKPAALAWQTEGFVWREAMVRLPAGIVAQDLNDHPKVIWKNVQRDPQKALRRFDRVTLVSFDESWMVKDAIVTEASADSVTLTVDKIVKLTARDSEWTDGEAVIRWAGGGYACYRRSDGVQLVPNLFASIAACQAEYQRIAPRKVA